MEIMRRPEGKQVLTVRQRWCREGENKEKQGDIQAPLMTRSGWGQTRSHEAGIVCLEAGVGGEVGHKDRQPAWPSAKWILTRFLPSQTPYPPKPHLTHPCHPRSLQQLLSLLSPALFRAAPGDFTFKRQHFHELSDIGARDMTAIFRLRLTLAPGYCGFIQRMHPSQPRKQTFVNLNLH